MITTIINIDADTPLNEVREVIRMAPPEAIIRIPPEFEAAAREVLSEPTASEPPTLEIMPSGGDNTVWRHRPDTGQYQYALVECTPEGLRVIAAGVDEDEAGVVTLRPVPPAQFPAQEVCTQCGARHLPPEFRADPDKTFEFPPVKRPAPSVVIWIADYNHVHRTVTTHSIAAQEHADHFEVSPDSDWKKAFGQAHDPVVSIRHNRILLHED